MMTSLLWMRSIILILKFLKWVNIFKQLKKCSLFTFQKYIFFPCTAGVENTVFNVEYHIKNFQATKASFLKQICNITLSNPILLNADFTFKKEFHICEWPICWFCFFHWYIFCFIARLFTCIQNFRHAINSWTS